MKKTGIIACLFCFSVITTYAQKLTFTEEERKAYIAALNLEWKTARTIEKQQNPVSIYIKGLNYTAELLINENKNLFSEYEKEFETSIATLQGAESPSAIHLFVEAEVRLQWAFVCLKYGQEFDAAYQLRKANQLTESCIRKNPNYIPIKKTKGLLQIILGSVPEKYNWLLSLMGMQGNVSKGLLLLHEVSTTPNELSYEAKLMLALVNGYVLQQTANSLSILKEVLEDRPGQRIACLMGASIALKNSNAQLAIDLTNQLDGKEIVMASYLLGEALLYKGEYLQAADAFNQYINNSQAENFLKDAYFKAGLCYLFTSQQEKAEVYFHISRIKGKTITEADKYAAQALEQSEHINVPLYKVRFFIDGGYYTQAREQIQSIASGDLSRKKDQIEFYYRQARLSHKTNQLPAAKLFYDQVIDMSGEPDKSEWYFAPNSCLQMGYLLTEQKNRLGAKKYFEKAISYKKHEYKNSIDSKAKSALGQLKDAK